MNFVVYGPFELPRNSANGLVASDAPNKGTFWAAIDDAEEGLSEACGCYIFAMSAGGSKRPWYIGKTEGSDFKNECFQPHKLNHYNNVLASQSGKPYLYLLPKMTQNMNFARPSRSGHTDIANLERILIGMALSRNKDLMNLHGTKYMRNITVRGIINSGPGNPGNAATDLKVTLGL